MIHSSAVIDYYVACKLAVKRGHEHVGRVEPDMPVGTE